MKRLLFLLTFLISHFLFSQEILNNSLFDPCFPVAYRGNGNRITLKGYENDSTIIFISLNDTLRKYGEYFYYEGSQLNVDTLKALKGGEVLTQKTYFIENLRNLKVYLGTIRDSIVTVDEILNNKSLIVSYEPQIAIPCTRILNFDGEIIKKNGKRIPLFKEKRKEENWSDKKWDRKLAKIERKGGTIYNGKNQFDSHQIKLIKRMKSGDMLNIQQGILSCSSCISRKIFIDLRLTIR